MNGLPERLVECVPNFSEGRRPEVIDELVTTIRGVPQVWVLDVHSDPDHNRSVVTCVGEPEALVEAMYRAIARAAALINLEEHTGEHPRIGATDVVPFVPLRGVTLADCVHLAHRLGQRVGEELGIPVYLYEAAATRPERQNLAHIRRGEYETLKHAIQTDPERAPDFGPPKLGPAGAVAIGARDILIAFNVYLNTDDVRIAQRIARAVRHANGGLRYVKALGMSVKGQAQVSMNLTNYRRTPIFRAVELIRQEAARYGCVITHTELVGLAPLQALLDVAQWYLQLEDTFSPSRVLEVRVAEVVTGQRPLYAQEE